MSFSAEEIRALSAADNVRGWAPVPEDCPPKFLNMILEKRARQIGLRASAPAAPAPVVPAVPQVDAAALRDRLSAVSLF